MFHYWACFAICVFLWGKPAHAQNSQEFWPELDTYVKLNSFSRLYFIAALGKEDDVPNLQGDFASNIDFFLKPLLRPRLREIDPAKNKLFLLRAGYRYLNSLTGDSPSEQRVVLQATARVPLPANILASLRGGFDLRWISGSPFSWRYRTRLMFERSFAIRSYGFTPYIRGEFFYDSRYSKISRTALAIGSTFPLTKRIELEPYFEYQHDTSKSIASRVEVGGLVLSLFF
jgi:hypothetical protein